MEKKTLGKHFRDFQKISAQWYALIQENMVYSDTNHAGKQFRRIALTHDRAVLEKATDLLVKWKAFADVCEAASDDGEDIYTLLPEFTPVPFILEDYTQSTRIVLRNAVTVRTLTRGFILKKYDNLIKHSKSSPIFATIAGALNKERKVYADDPEDMLYRARKGGFTDTILENSVNGEKNFDRYRVGTHGVLVFAHQPGTKLHLRERQKKRDSMTVYDGISALPCSPMADYQIYRISDLDAAQTSYVTVARLGRKVDMRKTTFARRARTIMAKVRAKNNPALEAAVQQRIEAAKQALEMLEEMDKKVFRNMLESGDDLTGIKLAEARKRYGGSVEVEYDTSFGKVMAATRLN